MGTLKIKSFCLGDLFTNAYLVINPDTHNCVLIDAPSGSGAVSQYIRDHEYHLQYILLTHGHCDHIAGLKEISSPVYIHSKDVPLLKDPSLNFSFLFNPFTIEQVPLELADNQAVSLDDHRLKILHTPGHTPGSLCVACEGLLFSGDTLFFDSVGRTDMPYSSGSQLIDSIKAKLFALPGEVKVFPGHGQDTTLKREIEHNPYLQATTL
ncbi:MAG: MBL fold metallo-hydrolase [Candidatus Omnitrophica bacterium]|nr:MBL fold metallo-hydrolase [Candidatus Omnitrophota bacterium]